MKLEILEAMFKGDEFGRDFFDMAYLARFQDHAVIYAAEEKCHSQYELQLYGFKVKFI